MNKQEILDEITKLKEKLNNLEKTYNSLTPPNKRWRAERKAGYYHIGFDGTVFYITEDASKIDDFNYTNGNYFQTKEEAEFEIERNKVIAELREWATPVNEFNWDNNYERKYGIFLLSNKVLVDYINSCQTSDLYFKTKEQAKNAIESVGEERIIKYYFRRGENNGSSN